MSSSKKVKRKNKKKYYQTSKKPKSGILEPGLKGFLITCNKEHLCIKEAYNLLNEYADELYGPEFENSENAFSGEVDIEEQLAKELQTVKSKFKRFQQVCTMVKGVLFIKTTVPDPIQLVTTIFESVLESEKRKTRFIQKLKPISITCKAFQADISKALNAFLSEYSQKEENQNLLYKVECNIRQNQNITSSHILWYVRESMEKFVPKWSVSLLNPEVVLSVDIMRNMCCIGFLRKFKEFKKYNLSETVPINVEKSLDCRTQTDTIEQPSKTEVSNEKLVGDS